MDDIRDIVVIGGGASAALLAWNLASRFGQNCTVVDPMDRPAFGLAYSTPSLKHLLNVPAKGMSASVEDADHFLCWMRANVHPDITAGTFVPRALYGLYLRQLYAAAAPTHVRDVAIGCVRDGALFTVSFASGRALRARQLVLACGHFDPARLPGIAIEAEKRGWYHHQAWEDAVYARIDPLAEVLLIGTGLTTVDVLMRLRETGHRGRVTAVSRHGVFPNRHGDVTPLDAPVFQPGDTPPTACAYLCAFRQALRQGVPWRAAVDSLRGVTNSLWLALPEGEKRRFRRHLQRRWDVVRHRMAPQIADMLDAERAAGTLRVLDGHVSGIVAEKGGLRITARASDTSYEIMADHAINCTGPSLNYRRSGSALLGTMLDAGLIMPGFGGGGLMCTAQGHLIDGQGQIVPGLMTIGPARLGRLFESIAIPEIREQAYHLATHLVGCLSQEHHVA